MTANDNPGGEGRNNQHARGDRKYHPRPALTILRLKLQEIPVARAAGGQMVQVRLRLGQWHPVRSYSSDNLVSGTSNALWIRELVAKPAT